jgi:hypothetical protein
MYNNELISILFDILVVTLVFKSIESPILDSYLIFL